MKIFITLILFAGLGIAISSCEERIRRQIWGPPPNPNPFWGNNLPDFSDGDYFDGPVDSWKVPSSFQQPSRNQNNFGGFRDDFGGIRDNGFGGGRNDRNQNNFNVIRDDTSSGGRRDDTSSSGGRDDGNQNRRRNKKKNQKERQNQSQSQSQNQNRRTTEDSRPLTTTPRTIHYAPQGCTCPMTQQFNPVCGTDGNTYRNEGLLNCYKRCGTNVSQKRLGTC